MSKRDTAAEAFAIIEKSTDPERAIIILIDICKRIIAGESSASIAASYGAPLEKIKALEAMEA